MFAINVEGESLDLFPNQNIEFFINSPLFNPNQINGNGTLPFTVPNTPKNRRIFGNYEKSFVSGSRRKYYCEKEALGGILEKGYIMLQNADDSVYQLFFTQNLQEIFGAYQQTLLNKLDLGSENAPTSFTASVNHLTAKYGLPSIHNSQFYQNNSVGGFNNIVNEYNGSSYVSASPKVPMIFFNWLIAQLENICGLKFKGSFFQNADIHRLMFYNTFSLDGMSSITYANHLPEISIQELFLELRRWFNLAYFFDVKRKSLTMEFIDDILQLPCTIDWSSKTSAKNNKIPEAIQRLNLEMTLDSGDGFTKLPHLDFDKYQSPVLNLESQLLNVKTLFSSLQTHSSGIAQAEQKGITSQFGQMNEKFTPRMLLWNGIVSGKPTALNNYGSSRLAYYGTNNIYEKYWKRYEKWMQSTFMVEKDVFLTAADIVSLDMRQKVHISNTNYYISSMSISLKNEPSKFVKAKLKLYRA